MEKTYSDKSRPVSRASGKSGMTGITGLQTALSQNVAKTDAGKSAKSAVSLKGYRSTEEYMKA